MTDLESWSRSVLVGFGLSDGNLPHQSISYINLERPDSVKTVDATPTWIGVETAVCVLDNVLYAVGLGKSYKELWKWSEESDWTKCNNMKTFRRRHCVAASLLIAGCTLWVGFDEKSFSHGDGNA